MRGLTPSRFFAAAACTALVLAPPAALAQRDDAVAQLRAADIAWSHAVAAKNVPRSLAALTPDAGLMAPNHPTAYGRAGITRALTLLFKQRVTLRWSPIDAGVAASGDLGYTRGTYVLDAVVSGKAVHDRGKYVTVWRKDGGAWKVYLDIFNSDLPAK